MTEWDRLSRQAKVYKGAYPPGTRILLISMDDRNPVPPNTRGTVKSVDDFSTIHCRFDNGRNIGIVPGQDSFRKLTQEEIEEENNAICVEETSNEDIENEQGEGFVQSM